ncbi:MAG: matrixin family metalloprotease [Gemmatales bacterium]
MQRNKQLQLEALEDRQLPATFGIPWSDPTHLTLSFVPDGTDVGGTSSNLFATLNQKASTTVWQSEILRAVQSWVIAANLNVGMVSDNGAPLGTAEPLEGIAPFGTIRIAAKPMASNILAIGIPPNEFGSSSWAGDIIFNSNANLVAQRTDLYTVFLHEVGHALGVGPSTNPGSVMYQQIVGKRTGLAATDYASILSLYGTRLPDRNEVSKNNDSLKQATRIDYEDSGIDAWTGSTPLIAFGDITRLTDVDYYQFENMANYSGPIQFRLVSTGISLLNAKLTVVDAKGKTVAVGQPASGGMEVSVNLPASKPETKYYLRVEAVPLSRFTVGRFAIVITLPEQNTISPDQIDTVIRGRFDQLASDDLSKLFSVNPDDSLFEQDDSTDDSFAQANRLIATNALGTRFQAIGSLQAAGDVDSYRLRLPKIAANNLAQMTITVTPYMVNGVMPSIQIFNKNQVPVPFTILSNGNGVFVVQATGLRSLEDYFIQVMNPPGTGNVGNYQFAVRMSAVATLQETFVQGDIPSTGGVATLYVADPQMFHLLLSTNNGVAVTMTIETLSGQPVFAITSNGLPTNGVPVLLQPGEYRVRFTTAGLSTRVLLRGDTISDPIGSVVVDPNQTPLYRPPGSGTNNYPNGTVTTKPFLFLTLTL